ncbi:Type II secretory pathway, component PulL [Serratia plymuthica]|uniref:Type II secretory pathway, component PulL n=1 Tax=Serratia plymuthica TaxID=82996 RepID=A0A2X4UJ92_SERPL|nr:Type II secretory pathway, component PulL [Serratia plymuthica]
MQTWCERLRACGLHADKMLPDVLALPLPGECSVAYWPDRWLIRTGKWQGMQLPCAWEDTELPVTPDLCIHAVAVCPRHGRADPAQGIRYGNWRTKPGAARATCCRGNLNPPQMAAVYSGKDRLCVDIGQLFVVGLRFVPSTEGRASRKADGRFISAFVAGAAANGFAR